MIVSSIRTGVIASIAIHVAALAIGPLRLQPPPAVATVPMTARLMPPRERPREEVRTETRESRRPEPAKPRHSPKKAPVERLAGVRAPSPAVVEAPQPPSPAARPSSERDVASAVPSVPASAPAPVAISEPVFDASYLRNPPPAYPALSRRLHEQGRVLLRVLVSAAGTPDEVELRGSSGYSRLDETARDTVRRWKFVPARRGAEPVAAWVLVPISFRLES